MILFGTNISWSAAFFAVLVSLHMRLRFGTAGSEEKTSVTTLHFFTTAVAPTRVTLLLRESNPLLIFLLVVAQFLDDYS